MREYFLQESLDIWPALGHAEIREVRKQDSEAFMRGLDLYLDDEFDQEWLLWAKQRSFYNNWCDRNYDEKGNFMLSASNPYMALRMDRKKAEEYLGPL